MGVLLSLLNRERIHGFGGNPSISDQTRSALFYRGDPAEGASSTDGRGDEPFVDGNIVRLHCAPK